MPVARHSPHRSVHEELPHTAPTSGNDANTHQRIRMAHDLTYPLKRTGRACPTLYPGHVLLNRIPLGQPPSFRGLRRPSSDVVRPLPRYYCAVRLLMPVHHWIVSLDFPMRPWYSPDKGGHRISQFPCKVFPYAPRSPTARGPDISRVTTCLVLLSD